MLHGEEHIPAVIVAISVDTNYQMIGSPDKNFIIVSLVFDVQFSD